MREPPAFMLIKKKKGQFGGATSRELRGKQGEARLNHWNSPR